MCLWINIILKRTQSPILNIFFVMLFFIILIILLMNSDIVLSTSWTVLMQFTQNMKNNKVTIDRPRERSITKRISNFSKFRCTGDENNINAWPERLCVFNNICYNLTIDRFEYYRRLHNPKYPLFYDSYKGMLSEFNTVGGFVALTSHSGDPWTPLVIDQAYPSQNVTWLTNLHIFWRAFFGDNFGHAVWEDIGSIFYSLERMNEFDDDLMVVNFNPVSTTPEFQRFANNTLAALTQRKLLEYKSYLKSYKTDYVCFKRFMAGGNMLLIHSTVMKENHGRESLFYKWRSKIIAYHKLDPEYIPNRHRIVITNKSESMWAKATHGMHRAIANLKEVVTFVRTTYPKIPVEVVEWHKMIFVKQIELLLQTTILISPCGGVSMIAPFLPHDSHAILMDYHVTQDGMGFNTGASASMEGMLLNHFPHFKKDYYQIFNREDYVFDFEGTTDTRNEASILINMTRLHLLMESAMEDIDL